MDTDGGIGKNRPGFPARSDSVEAGSHRSVPTAGSHPLGSLKLHQADPSSSGAPSGHSADGAGHDDMPPLEDDTPSGEVSASAPPLHGMGGGDIVLILDLPEVYTVGYDCVSFTAQHFGGIRDAPPGAHFLWVAHPDGVSTRCGAWFQSTDQHRVHVLQWDKFNEVLTKPTDAEARIQGRNISTIHSKLIPYHDPAAVNTPGRGSFQGLASMSNTKTWDQLASHISDGVLNRIVGSSNDLWMVHTADHVKGAALLASEVELDKHISNPLLQGHELNFIFSQITKSYTTQNTGADRTLDATDATTHIVSLLEDPATGLTDDDMVAELQFAYIVGSLLGNDACIQQWWHMILRLVLRAYNLPTLRPSLAAALLRTVAAQLSHSLKYLDTSILDYSYAQARDLRLSLMVYKRRIDELGAEEATVAAPAALALRHIEAVVAQPPLEWDLHGESYVRKGMAMTEYGEQVEVEMAELQAEDERGEWAPEVVELDESGREKGLVSWSD